MTFQVWVDADACPRPVKEVLFRAADRRQVGVTLVANQFLQTPPSKYISSIQVPAGFDVADNEIVRRLQVGDLVVTADIPLADEVITKGGRALNPRGTFYTPENIKDHLNRRDILDELRSSGMVSGGPDSYGKKEIQAFSNALDRELTKNTKA
ncbi:MAG: YaiI/YqxD family protein [Gammaproteobacteria bacterium]|nr:YaiI/YqxD family protein [Gammaproteobacteria bacterium]